MAVELNVGTALPHELSTVEVLARMGCDANRGLSAREAQNRLADAGPNALPESAPPPVWVSFLRQFCDVQVYLLVAAAGISLLVWAYQEVTGPPYESIAISCIVLLNATFDFIQDERAGRAVRALRSMTRVECRVIRDGELQRIHVREIVLGDLLVIEEGDRIAADARLVELAGFQVEEAALTGESFPVQKSLGLLPHDTPLPERTNMVHSGSIAVAGHAKAVATATGARTEFGRVAQLLDETAEPETPLKQELQQLGKGLSIAILFIAAATVAIVIGVNGVNDVNGLLRALIFGIALAVAATPEGLASVVAVVLAIGVQRMAKRGAIVRHQTAVETLGEVTVIASDKTGTMTLNQTTVTTIVTAAGTATREVANDAHWHLLDGRDIPNPARELLLLVLRLSTLASNASARLHDGKWVAQGDPTEAAIVRATGEAGIGLDELRTSCPREHELPFSSERKRMSTLHRCPVGNPLLGRRVWITKGAPHLLLGMCEFELWPHETRTLAADRRAQIDCAIDEMASKGLRTLAVALVPAPMQTQERGTSNGPPESGQTFVGLIGISDPLRPDAKPAVQAAAAAGIRTILVTGDHEKTALNVARALGIPGPGVLTTLSVLTDSELAEQVQHVSVFARVTPEDKLRIVRALQRNGEIVAMTGDGVNDAPALKAADIGISMGLTGTDVAKEAADLILTDDNFATIVAAIEEGRTIFSNIRKFLRYLLATNFGEILALLGGVILMDHGGAHELVVPLLASQILWINLVTDGAPALGLGLDPPSIRAMLRAPFSRGVRIVDRAMMQDIGIVAMLMAAGTVWVFLHAADSQSLELRRTMAFVTLILFQLLNAFEARSSIESGLTGLSRSKWLLATVLVTLAIQIPLLHTRFFTHAFGVESLSPAQWAECAVIATSVLCIMELVKCIRRRSLRGRDLQAFK